MKTMNKGLLAAAIVAGSISSAQATVLTFDDSSLGGDNVFDFDEISISDVDGSSFITQTDTNGDGTLIGDTFAEIGLTSSIRFNLNDSPLTDATTGLITEYELLFDVAFSGSATAVPIDADNADLDNDNTTGTDLVILTATFGPASVADLWYDTTIDSAITGGTATKIGSFTGGSGNCVVQINVATGNETGGCDINFDYLLLSSGVMLFGGNSLETVTPVTANIDINVDEFDPGLSFFYPGGAGSSQTTGVTHDGTVRINVPEPSTVALLGLGLLGFAASARRKAKA